MIIILRDKFKLKKPILDRNKPFLGVNQKNIPMKI